MSRQYALRIDPVKLSIAQNRMDIITEEMATTMLRTARSTVAASAKDFAACILDRQGWLLAVKESLPCILWGQGLATRAVMEYYHHKISPGDLFLLNDPFTLHAGGHLNDWTFILPVFYKGELVFWTAIRLHQLDIGGNVPGGFNVLATDIHQEGIRIPPVKIYDAGIYKWDVMELLLANVRVPVQQRGDIMAMIGALRTGEKRLHELIEKNGLEFMKLVAEDLLDSTEAAMRTEIEKLPDGIYGAESSIDGDPYGGPYTCRVKVIIEGDGITVDFSRSDPAVKGWMNSSYNNTYTNALLGVVTSVGAGLPHNEGMLKPLKLIAPEGTIVNAAYPHAVGRGTVVTGAAILQTVWKAMSAVIPERSTAAYSMGGSYLVTSGTDPRTGEPYTCLHFPAAGGGGANWGCDGWHSVSAANAMGSIYSGDVEIYESKYPYFITRLALNRDSGGPGRWRGGLGVDYRWINEGSEGILVPIGDQHVVPQPGVLGGKAAPLNRARLTRSTDGSEVDITRKEIFNLQPGDMVLAQTAGGAGVGDPLEREPDMVREDVINERVSPLKAKEDYGVIFKADRWPYELDLQRTAEYRAELKRKKRLAAPPP